LANQKANIDTIDCWNWRQYRVDFVSRLDNMMEARPAAD
jgi:hypothetical protein